jgi:hypothetical protein
MPAHFREEVEQFPVIEGSVFDELRKVSRWLAAVFPWQTRDATWFVLTGASPPLPPLQLGLQRRSLRDYARTALVLTVEPWISSKSLTRVFRAYQRVLLGRENRPILEKNLELFEFVAPRRELVQKGQTWNELRSGWNRQHRQWAYVDNRHFRRDYLRVRQTLAHPEYAQLVPPHR